jgi:glyoxylase-like metal-dependent hydrolase (beta-lactamase superfamily II)
MKYEIIPMVLGRIGEDRSAMTYFVNPGVKIDLPVTFFYIKGGDKNILVDTGCPAEISRVYHPNDPVSDIQTFEEALAKQGLKPEHVDIVIQTHLHYDHCANTGKCRNAKVIAQEAEIKFALAPHPVFAGMYFRHLFRDLRFQPVKGDTEIVDGVRVLFTPGHTPGGQSVAVETVKGTAIIPGFCSIRDTFEVSPETQKMFPAWFVHTPGIHTDALAAFDSALRVKWLADILVPSHDPELENIAKIP